MQPSSPVPDPPSSPTVAEPDPAALSGLGGPLPPPHGGGRLVLSALGIGLGVGIVSWLIGEAAEDAFSPRTIAGSLPNGIPTRIITDSARSVATIRNVTLSSGLFGALLGSSLGLAGAFARRDPRAVGRTVLIGLATGALAGAGAALPLVTLYFRSFERYAPEGLIEPLLVHAGIWGAIGAAGGLAFGLGAGGRGQWLRGLVGGLVGAVLGAAIYEIVGATAFPMSRTFLPSAAEWPPRLMARLLVATLAAVGAALAVADGGRSKHAA